MKIKSLLFFLLLPLFLVAQEESQTFISLKQTGVEDFLKTYPEFDGRGTIVLILDSGVDMGLDGLKLTSTGELKVIDVQDFSRQGDITYYEADIDEEDDIEYFVNEDFGYKVAGVASLKHKPVDDNYFIGLLDEKLFLNAGSDTPDLNENGSREDKFYFVTFKVLEDGNEHWVVYFDKDADGDLSDESVLKNYKDQLEPFFIQRWNAVPYLTFGLNIFPEKNIVNFFFDDNGHGTHCAGISTGYRIGNSDFNGVAPGAKVIGLKIGNNEFSGGATVTESMKRAYEYADKLARERKEPIIINMSYGVGSEIEGHSDMEKYLDNLALNNPYLYICKSAGNDGPGISTIGQPSASKRSIVVGAALTKEIAGDLYGARHKEDVIYAFSARGAEFDKPDVQAPGGSFSTIPNHAGYDGMQGTSMSSPYVAGVVSLLMSAVTQKYPEVKITSFMIQRVLRESAQWMDGYTHLDQGAGMVNVYKAWELLEQYIKSGETEKMETYSISGFSAGSPDNTAQALYIRNGSYLTGKESYRFNIARDNTIKQNKFYRVFDLKSDSDWLLPAQKRTHMRNDQKSAVDVEFDVSKMTEPGLYNGKIYATRQGTEIPEFELMATVVIPYQFNESNNYKMKWNDRQLEPTRLHRYFINVPAGATSMKVNITVEENEYGKVYYTLFNPEGRNTKYSRIMTSYNEKDEIEDYIYDIYPGVWELVVTNRRTSSNSAEYNLSVEFDGINRIGYNVISESHNSFDVVNEFNEFKQYNLSGLLFGYEKMNVKKIAGYEILEIPFTISSKESKKTFEIWLSKEDFNKNTDFAFLIYDDNGEKLRSGALGYQDDSITLNYKEGYEDKKFVLKIVPGFVYEDMQAMVHITEKVFFEKPLTLEVKNDGESMVSLYPSIKEKLTLSADKPDGVVPEGVMIFGTVYFKTVTGGITECELPVKYKF